MAEGSANSQSGPCGDSSPSPYAAEAAGSIDFLPALFLTAAIVFLPLRSESGPLHSLGTVFVGIVLEAIPFMLVGSLVGGLIEAFVSRERMAALLPRKGWLTVCVAAGAGLVFPVCECAVVPVVRRLTGKGLPFSAAIAYLLGGPIVNPIVAASTALAYAFDWRMAALRLGLGYGIAVAVGLVMGKLFSGAEAIKGNGGAEVQTRAAACGGHSDPLGPSHCGAISGQMPLFPVIPNSAVHSPAGHPVACGCGCVHPVSDGWLGKTGAAFAHAKDDFLAVGHYLVIGAFIAAMAQTYIDRSSFLGLAAAPVLSAALMMALAVLLNLCSEADAFIAASFRGLMPIPAQLAFLLTGPMFDLKLLLMYQSVFTRRAIVALASLILAAVLAVAAGLEMLNGGLG